MKIWSLIFLLLSLMVSATVFVSADPVAIRYEANDDGSGLTEHRTLQGSDQCRAVLFMPQGSAWKVIHCAYNPTLRKVAVELYYLRKLWCSQIVVLHQDGRLEPGPGYDTMQGIPNPSGHRIHCVKDMYWVGNDLVVQWSDSLEPNQRSTITMTYHNSSGFARAKATGDIATLVRNHQAYGHVVELLRRICAVQGIAREKLARQLSYKTSYHTNGPLFKKLHRPIIQQFEPDGAGGYDILFFDDFEPGVGQLLGYDPKKGQFIVNSTICSH